MRSRAGAAALRGALLRRWAESDRQVVTVTPTEARLAIMGEDGV